MDHLKTRAFIYCFSAGLLTGALTTTASAADLRPACPETPSLGSGVVLLALALIPIAGIATTSFVKLSIVFSILRNALGIGQTPSGTIIAVLAGALTYYVMAPVGRQMLAASASARSTIDFQNPTSPSSLKATLAAFHAGKEPLEHFLRENSGSREKDLFVSLAQRNRSRSIPSDTVGEDLSVVIPAFLLTELKEAFQIGFIVYIPFLIIEMVVANLLLALGMAMISPAAISLPFKLLVFVLTDGWYLLSKALVLGYKL
jgi:type III secretion protein R